MNILFLVFGFLLIFLFFSSTLLQQTIYFSSEQKSSCSYVDAKHKIHDKLERYKYKSYQEKTKKANPSETKTSSRVKKEGEYLSHRFRANLSAQAKWNLAPLISQEKITPHLKGATISFLAILYGHTDFWEKEKKENPDFAETLLDSFKKKDFAEKISDLFPEDLSLQPIFYKMLKGSGSYDIASKQGHPPLEDFFRLEKENTHTLSLSYACFPALQALLGEDLLEKVLRIEKEKWEKKGAYYSVTKKEFTDLTSYLGLDIPIQEWEALLLGGYKKAKLERITHKEGKRAFLEIPLP
ncbi:MAG: hypothetical protein V4489_01685 [Chlamydiota bacterium]